MFRLLLASLVFQATLSATPYLVAHRGASADAPENTLPAFQLAWEQGADAIEGDFRLTRDGRIVCIHDDTTKRTGNRNLNVAASTLEELRQLDVGAWLAPQWKGTRIPTLEEVLATVPEQGTLFLEIKSGPEIVPPVLALLDRSPLRPEQVVMICFQEDVVRAYKQAAPRRAASWLCGFKRKAGRTTPSLEAALKTYATTGAEGFSTNAWAGIDRHYLARIRQHGGTHHVWTVDDADTARRFLELGTATVTTNRPGALRRELAP